MQRIRISAVSYLNTKPFLYGIQNSDALTHFNIDLKTDLPSVCAEKLLANEADLGLVPVAIIPKLKEYHIISDYCIGAIGPVKTVMLY
ncbi:MAG: ABC transporter substrate-binding protein, partial [Bacteroidetes bacterium]|nr:ABC transporter substrate-binding protein [Bacteroidota bacterium]